jgi:hypothetical protein
VTDTTKGGPVIDSNLVYLCIVIVSVAAGLIIGLDLKKNH